MRSENSSSLLRRFDKMHLQVASDEAAAIRRFLRSIESSIKSDRRLSLSKFIPAGSFAKGTALQGNREADIVIIFPRNVGITHQELVEIVETRVTADFGQKNGHIESVSPRAIRLSLSTSGGDYSFDILPGFETVSIAQLSEVSHVDWYHGSKSKYHLEYVKRQSEKNSCYRQLVRLVKHWVRFNRLPLSGFQVELITAWTLSRRIHGKACRHIATSLKKTLCGVVAAMDGKPMVPVNWDQGQISYKWARRKHPDQRVIIVDPADLEGNVADRLSFGEISQIRKIATRAIFSISSGDYGFIIDHS